MSTDKLLELLRKARTFATTECEKGLHLWASEGGRTCPKDEDNDTCSQTVYRCSVCGLYDHGEPGFPAYAECNDRRICQYEPEQLEHQ